MLFFIFLLLFPLGIAGASWIDVFNASSSRVSDTESILLYGLNKGTASFIISITIIIAFAVFAIKAYKSAPKDPNDTAYWYKKEQEEKKNKNKDKDDNDGNRKTDTRIH